MASAGTVDGGDVWMGWSHQGVAVVELMMICVEAIGMYVCLYTQGMTIKSRERNCIRSTAIHADGSMCVGDYHTYDSTKMYVGGGLAGL